MGFVGAVNEAARAGEGPCAAAPEQRRRARRGALAAAVATLQRRRRGRRGRPRRAARRPSAGGGLDRLARRLVRGVRTGDDPDAGPYRFRRDVDFCSGVFLLVRADCWRRLGGLDAASLPPTTKRSTSACARGRPAGVSSTSQAVSSITTSRPRRGTTGRWDCSSESLAPGCAARRVARDRVRARGGESARGAHRERLSGRRILVLDDMVPHPFEGSGCPRLRAVLALLLDQGLEVTFYPTQFPDEDWRVVSEAVPPQVEVTAATRNGRPRRVPRRAPRVLSRAAGEPPAQHEDRRRDPRATAGAV